MSRHGPGARLEVVVDGEAVRIDAGAAALVGADVARACTRVGPAGTVVLDGVDLSGAGRARRVRAGLVVLGEVSVAPDVEVADHLRAVAPAGPSALAGAPLLDGRGADPAGWLSGGERQVLGWLQARLLQPRAVVLDGAGRGLDAATLDWAGEVVAGWRRDGVAVAVRAGRGEEEPWASG